MKDLLDKASYGISRSNKEYSTAHVMFCGDCGHSECGCEKPQHKLFVGLCDEGEPGADRDQKALTIATLSSINESVARKKFLGYPEDVKLSRAR